MPAYFLYEGRMNFNFSCIKHLQFYLTIMLCTLLSACQKPASEIKTDSQEQPQAEKVVPDLNHICQHLKSEMQQMSNQRTTFALEQINQEIRLCLPLVSHEEQKVLMRLSDQMYQQFLQIDRTAVQQEAFDLYAFDQSQFPTIQQSHFEKLHIRDQYLLRHKGQAYIELDTENPYQINYKRNVQYLAKVFAPYFPEDEQIFIQELADQNLVPAFQKNTLLISSHEILDRALMWEDYLQRFPNSPYRKDAQYLLNVYSSLFFIGLSDSPVSINFDGKLDISPNTLSEIEQLATMKNSRLADQARKFLKYIELSSSERGIKTSDESSLSDSTLQVSGKENIAQALNLNLYDFSHSQKRDCFTDAICR